MPEAMARIIRPWRRPSAMCSRSSTDKYRDGVEPGRGIPCGFASCNHLVPCRRCTPTSIEALVLSNPQRRAAQYS
jgi:hypothetical protein